MADTLERLNDWGNLGFESDTDKGNAAYRLGGFSDAYLSEGSYREMPPPPRFAGGY
jgi:hypothetical protein